MRNTPPPPGQVPGDEDKNKVVEGAKAGVLHEGVQRAMMRVCRWKAVLAMWQLGDRAPDDGEFRAACDVREQEILRIVEGRAIIGALLAKKIISKPEWANALIMEAMEYERQLEQRFPGFRANDTGIEIASKVAEETKRKYNFPE